ncbi:MAG: DUF6249 domain-containing protein [Bacteroidota bacterium]
MDSALSEVLMPISVLGSMTLGTYVLVKTITDYILKKKMIEKGFVNDETQAIFKEQQASNLLSPLKWGLIIFFGGLSLIIMEYIPVKHNSPLPFGLVALFVSLGFLTYYFIAKREMDKNKPPE